VALLPWRLCCGSRDCAAAQRRFEGAPNHPLVLDIKPNGGTLKETRPWSPHCPSGLPETPAARQWGKLLSLHIKNGQQHCMKGPLQTGQLWTPMPEEQEFWSQEEGIQIPPQACDGVTSLAFEFQFSQLGNG
jgi:hypothetical protein